MERQRSGKLIAVVALLFAVAGLSLGFAAFSTTLNITSTADVKLDDDVWEVGFSTVNSGITAGSVTGVLTGSESGDTNGTLDLTQFVISQTTPATLHTTNGSKVEYSFYIVNDGKLDAYLNSVTVGHLTCTYASASGTEDDGHTVVTAETGTIDQSVCETLFTATLDIGTGATTKVTGESQTSGFGNTNKLAKPNGTPTYVPAKLTIAYNSNSFAGLASGAPLGDFTVALGNSTVVYGTSSN